MHSNISNIFDILNSNPQEETVQKQETQAL